MWEKIVLNLLSNAFKFTLQGRIAVRLRADRTHAILSVEDTGTGVPEDELLHIFERFHRVAGAKGRMYEGTGIGLALIQELVKLHGGTIGVESRVGVGTCFTVRLPLGSTHLPEKQLSTETGSPSPFRRDAYVHEARSWLANPSADVARLHADKAAGPRPRVLLADDNADMR